MDSQDNFRKSASVIADGLLAKCLELIERLLLEAEQTAGKKPNALRCDTVEEILAEVAGTRTLCADYIVVTTKPKSQDLVARCDAERDRAVKVAAELGKLEAGLRILRALILASFEDRGLRWESKAADLLRAARSLCQSLQKVGQS